MTNIRCKGNKEVDLLAVNPLTNEKYHIESRVSTTFKLRREATYSKRGRCYRNGLDYFAKEKFNHPYVVEKIKEYFGSEEYDKKLVVYSLENANSPEEKRAFIVNGIKDFNIHVTTIGTMIDALIKSVEPMGSRDDVLRILELISAETRKKRMQGAKYWDKRGDFYSRHMANEDKTRNEMS